MRNRLELLNMTQGLGGAVTVSDDDMVEMLETYDIEIGHRDVLIKELRTALSDLRNVLTDNKKSTVGGLLMTEWIHDKAKKI